MPRSHVQRLTTYWCLYSSHRSAQYAAVALSSVEKSKEEQPICVTTSGAMPTVARAATVAFGLPSNSAEPVVAMAVSTAAHCAGRAHGAAGSWPEGERSCCTAARKDEGSATLAPSRPAPQVPETEDASVRPGERPPRPKRRAPGAQKEREPGNNS